VGAAELIFGALRLDPAAFEALVGLPAAARFGLVVLAVAGVSQALGQSVALFANRVRPRRFVLASAVAAGLFVASVVVWSAALALSAAVLADARAPLDRVVAVVGLGHAPRLLAFLTLIPYFGSGIGVTLTIWTFLATAVGAGAVFGLDLTGVLLVLGAAWLATEAAGRTIGRPVTAATRRLRAGPAGPAAGREGGAP
jgi:hypothetical protein